MFNKPYIKLPSLFREHTQQDLVPVFISTLTIFLDNGMKIEVSCIVPTASYHSVWNDFRHWFYGRSQSETFTVLAKDCEQTLFRKNIYMFKIERKTTWETSDGRKL